jgi:hypothetical protein
MGSCFYDGADHRVEAGAIAAPGDDTDAFWHLVLLRSVVSGGFPEPASCRQHRFE